VGIFKTQRLQLRQHFLGRMIWIGCHENTEGFARRLGRDIDFINSRRLCYGRRLQK